MNDNNWVDRIMRKGEMAEPNWVVHKLAAPEGELDHMIFCPACQCGHGFKVKTPGAVWSFNGDMIKPTVNPSIRTEYYNWKLKKKMICHFHIVNGNIAFCEDCSHEYANKTVPLEPF